MTTTTIPKAGDRGTIKPLGQKRRQSIEVVRIEQDFFVVGLLESKKYPGNYRGWAVGTIEDFQPVEDG